VNISRQNPPLIEIKSVGRKVLSIHQLQRSTQKKTKEEGRTKVKKVKKTNEKPTKNDTQNRVND